MEEVEFDVDIKRHIYLVPIAGFVLDRLRKKAKSQGLSTETLVNVLLQEHSWKVYRGRRGRQIHADWHRPIYTDRRSAQGIWMKKIRRWAGELMSKGRRRKEKIRNRLKDIRRALFPLNLSVVYGPNIRKPNQIWSLLTHLRWQNTFSPPFQ